MKIAWDMLHFIIILVLLFLLPLNVCFKLTFDNFFREVLAGFFLIDILLNMNTSYFNKGFLVKNRKAIIIHYFKTELFMDVSTAVLYFIDMRDYHHWAFFKMWFLLRSKKIGNIYEKLQEKFKISLKVHPSFIDLINLLFFSFFILHIFACFWFYIAFIDQDNPNAKNWLTANDLNHEDMVTQYLYAFYWSTVTIMTVGYGDISAKNTIEVIFSSFTIFFGCALFAYFVNSVGVIVQDIKKDTYIFKYLIITGNAKNTFFQIFRTKMNVINKYMEKKNIDHNLQMKIREYLRFIWEEESTQNAELEAEIIEKLSKSLKSELTFESYGQIFQKYPLFFANFSEKCLTELMYKIKEVRNIPEDNIFTVFFF